MSSQGQKLIEAQMAAYQPESFAFTDENLRAAKKIIAKYPQGKQQSALMPLLTMAQKQNANWLPVAAMDYVADMLQIPRMRAYEVATFYTMYNLAPVGRHMIEVCTTTPCWLRGSDDIVKACKNALGIGVGETTPDGMFTLKEAECLAACVNAPMIQIGDYYYEDLNPDSMREIIDDLRAGKAPKAGSRNRHTCEPYMGATTLNGDAGKPKKQKASAEEDRKTRAHSDDAPNVPSEDMAKAKPKDVRKPVADTLPTTEDVAKGKKPAKAKETKVASTPGKAGETQPDNAGSKPKKK